MPSSLPVPGAPSTSAAWALPAVPGMHGMTHRGGKVTVSATRHPDHPPHTPWVCARSSDPSSQLAVCSALGHDTDRTTGYSLGPVQVDGSLGGGGAGDRSPRCNAFP